MPGPSSTNGTPIIAHQLILLKVQRPEGRMLAIVGAGHRQGIDEPPHQPGHITSLRFANRGSQNPFPGQRSSDLSSRSSLHSCLPPSPFPAWGGTVLLYAFLFWVIIHGNSRRFLPFCRWASLFCPRLPVRGMDDIAQPDAPCGMDRRSTWKPGSGNPRFTDFRKIYETESLTEMAKIPLFKVVLVAALANVGSILGTILYFIFVFPLLKIDPVS